LEHNFYYGSFQLRSVRDAVLTPLWFGNGSPLATEITIFGSDSGVLTKRIKLNEDGKVSITPAAMMSRGSARRCVIADVRELATVIEELKHNEAITLGRSRVDLPDQVAVVPMLRRVGRVYRAVVRRWNSLRPQPPTLVTW
jgi:hypothetical protein